MLVRGSALPTGRSCDLIVSSKPVTAPTDFRMQIIRMIFQLELAGFPIVVKLQSIINQSDGVAKNLPASILGVLVAVKAFCRLNDNEKRETYSNAPRASISTIGPHRQL